GPYDATYPWNPQSIKACYKVIATIYELTDRVTNSEPNPDLLQAFHKMVKNITKMMEDLKMNSAVSEIMIFVNFCKKQKEINIEIWQEFSKIIAPITPFIAEQIWQELGGFGGWKKDNSVHLQAWPLYLEELAQDAEILIPVQINGKVRATLSVARDITEEDIKAKVFALPDVIRYVNPSMIKKFIYIKNKIVSISV
ncbi:MAG: class I tRNA ligase family protein, partial [Candidatus Pacearchaeota archaeon]